MHLEIEHKLRYRYEPAAFIEPMTLRLRPRSDGAQHLTAFELTLDPAPIGRTEALDQHGNVATWAWFEGQHEQLHITARSRVETLLKNPFDYVLLDAGAQTLPAAYDPQLNLALAPFRERHFDDAGVAQLAEALGNEAGGETQRFLSETARHLDASCELVERAEGEPYAPAVTWQLRRGACRDLAVLFVDLCQCMGLAARFVSGYQYQPADEGVPQLHAWAEVYLPGAGWRGYDPSAGVATADHHVAVAAGRAAGEAAPTQGAFRRTGGRSHLTFDVTIRELHASHARP